MKNKIESINANSSNVDIDLVKNLIVGYLTATNATAKNQILKLISNVLNLNEADCIKIGLRNSNEAASSGWFSRSSMSDNINNNVSLTEAFVTFLEKESQPRVNSANLLTIHEHETPVRKSSISALQSGNSSSNEKTTDTNSENPAPIVLGENTLLAYNNRNSSSILKDILHDT